MAKRITYGEHEIVILDSHETILHQCEEGDVAISLYDTSDKGKGYGVTFVGRNKQLSGWEGAYLTPEDAIRDILSNA